MAYSFNTTPIPNANMSLPKSYSSTLFRNSSFYQPIDSITHSYNTYFVVVMSVIIVLFMVASLVGNMLVILSVCRFPAMRTRTNLFLVNLAVTDVMMALLNMPVALVTIIQGRWMFGDAGCQFNGFFFGLGTVLSIHTMMHIR